jgi:hypothetical protein
MHVVWAELCDRPGDAREKRCSARELNHHFTPDLCAYEQDGVEEFQGVTTTRLFPLFWDPSRLPLAQVSFEMLPATLYRGVILVKGCQDANPPHALTLLRRAASVHVAVAPPSAAKNFRRSMWLAM